MTEFIYSDNFLLILAVAVSIIGSIALISAQRFAKKRPPKPSKLLELAPPEFNGIIGDSAYVTTLDDRSEEFQINGVVAGKDINSSMKAQVVGIVLDNYVLYGAEDPNIAVEEPTRLSLKHGWNVSLAVKRNEALEYAVNNELKQSKVIFIRFRS